MVGTAASASSSTGCDSAASSRSTLAPQRRCPGARRRRCSERSTPSSTFPRARRQAPPRLLHGPPLLRTAPTSSWLPPDGCCWTRPLVAWTPPRLSLLPDKAATGYPPPRHGRHRIPSSPPAPLADPLLHLFPASVHSRDGADLTFLLSYWLCRARVVQWPQEHARERRAGSTRAAFTAVGGGYLIYKDYKLARDSTALKVEVRLREGPVVNIHMLCACRPGILLSAMKAIEALGLDVQQVVISCFNCFALDVFKVAIDM